MTATTGSGIATFSSLVINITGNYTLTASVGSTTTTASSVTVSRCRQQTGLADGTGDNGRRRNDT